MISSLDESYFLDTWRCALDHAIQASGQRYADTAAWLGLAPSCFNKRRRGEVPFSPYHFGLLSDRYGLPPTPQAMLGQRLQFAEGGKEGNGGGYLDALRDLVRTVVPTGECPTLHISTTEAPILTFLSDPLLLSFKLYLFASTSPGFTWQPFVPTPLDERTQTSAREVIRAYERYRSVEVWGDRPFASITKQIDALALQHLVGAATAQQLYDRLDARLARLKSALVAQGHHVELYVDKRVVTSPVYWFTGFDQPLTLLTYDMPNYLVSRDPNVARILGSSVERRRESATRVGPNSAVSSVRFTGQVAADLRAARSRTEQLLAISHEL